MHTNDTRHRVTGNYTVRVENIYSWQSPFITFHGPSTKTDETVESYRTPRIKPKYDKKTGKRLNPVVKPPEYRYFHYQDGKLVSNMVREPNDFKLWRVKHNRPAMDAYIDRYLGDPERKIWVSGDMIERDNLPALVYDNGNVAYREFDKGTAAAINEAYAKANAPERLNGLVQIAEGVESFEMLRSIGIKGLKWFLNAKRNISLSRKIRITDVSLDDLSDYWLQYRYGFLPLYLSAMDIIQSLGKPLDLPWVFRGSSKTDVIEKSRHADMSVHGMIYREKYVTSRYSKAVCKLYGTFQRDPNPWGFGPHDAIIAAWEKVPLSFVLDWFVGVGDWISAYRPGGFSVRWSYCTYVQRITSTASCVSSHNSASPSDRSAMIHDPLTFEKSYVERRTNVSPSVFPAWEYEALKWYRQLDAISLLWGAVTGYLRGR